ncbi:hypothetical protein CERZMDRAFT_100027 [Cercospora zeae-maydis SCOH1-5]|uniref:Uncharacterized protein n=1 Tax=Cercospora zeae-maydis SCOH1-5 TaxID=717836 RepID=A0A6A6F9A7_9PEZI|nr:hypothetical protein CERZMDRAFT_100027 [Cercospora zeae-maydis SCOH1-5]
MRQPYSRTPTPCVLANAKVSKDRKHNRPNVRSRYKHTFPVREITLSRVKDGRIHTPQRYSVCRMYKHTSPGRKSNFRPYVWKDPNRIYQHIRNLLDRHHKLKRMTRAEWMASLNLQRLEDWGKQLLARVYHFPHSELQGSLNTGKPSTSDLASEGQTKASPKLASASDAPTQTPFTSTAAKETLADRFAKCFAGRALSTDESRWDAKTETQDATGSGSRVYRCVVESPEREHFLMERHAEMLARKKKIILEAQANFIEIKSSLFKHILLATKAVRKEQKELESLAATKKKEAEEMEKIIRDFQRKEDGLVDRTIALETYERSEVPKRQAPRSGSRSAASTAATAPPVPWFCAVKHAAAKKGWEQPAAGEVSEK